MVTDTVAVAIAIADIGSARGREGLNNIDGYVVGPRLAYRAAAAAVDDDDTTVHNYCFREGNGLSGMMHCRAVGIVSELSGWPVRPTATSP
ncbi:hypothetical protein [Echinococcus multilocularis]|uniref:Uncharacterized protein n=1 Tax=Echinococcus multilocularis TaxID=6211 RepID=A0A068Y888_ECHMU|nr:hypothetical protein [Echinococcus multilocularis]